jgi:glycosyltransferase involved in cell wall biosynthesis
MSKEQTYKATAIIPVSKMAGKLGNLAATIRTSEQHQFELILVHDIGDNDTSSQILDLITPYHNIKLLEGYYGSAGKARNAGITLASSKWLCFWDSDDLPNVEAIVDLIRQVEEDENKLGYGKFEFISSNDRQMPAYLSTRISTINNYYRYPGLWRWVFERDLVADNRFPDYRLGEDVAFLCNLLGKGGQISKNQNTTYYYFIGDSNQTTFSWKDSDSLTPVLQSIYTTTTSGSSNKVKIIKIALWQLLSSLRKDQLKQKLKSLFYFVSILIRITDFAISQNTQQQ